MKNKNLTLVIMAAGMGSRFGGLKQLTPIGPSGEFIIDYSIYDAIKAGFNKIVFIIKKEHLEDFKETIGDRVAKHVKVEYVFQEMSTLPEGYHIDTKREKPLGTGHAVYCCKDVVKEPFAVISADDFYGSDAFIRAASFLTQNSSSNITNYGMITCPIGKMMSEESAVKRGICRVIDGKLVNIIESSVEKKGNEIIATSLNTNKVFKVEEDTPASMSFFLLYPSIFKYLEQDLKLFLENGNVESGEFFLPDVVSKVIENKEGSVNIYNTTSTWYGMTYTKDKEEVENAINKLIEHGDYSSNLWK